MDGADICRASSWASRRPPDVISAVAILDPRWRRRKWRHPGPGAGFSTPIAEAEENGGPSASGRHLGWPHLREPEMRSSKMATGSGRAAIFLPLRNGGRKTRPILLPSVTHSDAISASMPIGWIPFIFVADTTHGGHHVSRNIFRSKCQSSRSHGSFRTVLACHYGISPLSNP